jgi:hypothetical protein
VSPKEGFQNISEGTNSLLKCISSSSFKKKVGANPAIKFNPFMSNAHRNMPKRALRF